MARPNLRGTSSLLLVVAIAAMGGFLFWLYQEASSLDEEVTPVMEDDSEAQFTLDSLRESQDGLVGRTVTLDSAPVANSLGRGVFTLRLNDTLAYPVLMQTDLIQMETNVIEGDQVTVRGRFYTLTDSIRSEWVSRGAVDSAATEEIPSSNSFMLADSVDIVVES